MVFLLWKPACLHLWIYIVCTHFVLAREREREHSQWCATVVYIFMPLLNSAICIVQLLIVELWPLCSINMREQITPGFVRTEHTTSSNVFSGSVAILKRSRAMTITKWSIVCIPCRYMPYCMKLEEHFTSLTSPNISLRPYQSFLCGSVSHACNLEYLITIIMIIIGTLMSFFPSSTGVHPLNSL